MLYLLPRLTAVIMTNVSKQKLNKKEQKKLQKQVTSLFARTDDRGAQALFGELFTESEQIMFMKRLAIIIMVDKEYSKYRISRTLKVSESTVREIRSKYYLDEYNKLLALTRSDTFDNEKFWETIEVLLRLGMPSMGKDRWKSLRM